MPEAASHPVFTGLSPLVGHSETPGIRRNVLSLTMCNHGRWSTADFSHGLAGAVCSRARFSRSPVGGRCFRQLFAFGPPSTDSYRISVKIRTGMGRLELILRERGYRSTTKIEGGIHFPLAPGSSFWQSGDHARSTPQCGHRCDSRFWAMLNTLSTTHQKRGRSLWFACQHAMAEHHPSRGNWPTHVWPAPPHGRS